MLGSSDRPKLPTDIITLVLSLAFGTVVPSEIQFIDDVFNNSVENEEYECEEEVE